MGPAGSLSAQQDFGRTFKIVGLFDENGDAITDYRFDSGIRISSVPEPSSMTLLAVGSALVGVAAVRGSRRTTRTF